VRVRAPHLARPLALVVVALAACSSGGAEAPGPAALDPVRAAPGPPPEPAALGLEGEAAESFRILLGAERFTDDAVGYAGITPLEVRAWRRLDAHPRSAEAFTALADHATLPGRLYAACGLFYADPDRFEREVAALERSGGSVELMRGCVILTTYPVGELVRVEGDRVVRLERRDQTTREWVRARGLTEGYSLDIAGGGYPDLFRNGGGWHEPRLEPLDPRAGR